jgi:hypothetical protein
MIALLSLIVQLLELLSVPTHEHLPLGSSEAIPAVRRLTAGKNIGLTALGEAKRSLQTPLPGRGAIGYDHLSGKW